MAFNPFSEYRPVKHKKSRGEDKRRAELRKLVEASMEETNPWHTWWEEFFPFLLFVFFFPVGFLIANLIGADAAFFYGGSVLTATVVALYWGSKKRKDRLNRKRRWDD